MAAPRFGGDRSRTLAPLIGALAVFAVVLALIFGVGSRGTGSAVGSPGTAVASDKALACPAAYQQTRNDTNGWVPHGPRGLNGDDRLVTTATPTHVVVCAYLDGADPSVTKTITLSGRSVLTGSLSGLVTTLSRLPRLNASRNTACASVLTQADTRAYLFGLRYGSATLWVSAPGYHCAGSTNGSFTTGTNLSADAAASYQAKRWTKG